MAKKAKAATHDAYGILNRYGDVWTPNWFDSPAEARQYVHDYWAGGDYGTINLDEFKVVPVKVRVSVASPS